jgi:hypothetical protein
MLRCMSPEMAHHAAFWHRSNLVAFWGRAEVDIWIDLTGSAAFDPKLPIDSEFCCGAQRTSWLFGAPCWRGRSTAGPSHLADIGRIEIPQ